MASVLVVGLNYRTAPVEVRERVGFQTAAVGEALRQLLSRSEDRLQEALILFTCNRTEVYATAEAAESAARLVRDFLARHGDYQPEALDSFLYWFAERDAVRHLFEVAAGLDSMVLGEAQILGQVKEAWRLAHEAGTLKAVGQQLFRHAVEAGKRVRRETGIGGGAASIPGAAVQLALKTFGSLEERVALVVGAGEMGELTARTLADQGVSRILVANRTRSRGEQVAARVGGRAVPYREACGMLHQVDIVITQTSAPHYVFTRGQLERIAARREGRPLFLIDISVPRVVEPDARKVPGIILYNVDDLEEVARGALEARRGQVEAARRIVEEEVNRFFVWRHAREVAPLIRALRTRAEAIRQDELERLYARLPSDLPAETVALIDASTRAMIQKLLHTPTVRLKQASRAGQAADAKVLARLFGLG